MQADEIIQIFQDALRKPLNAQMEEWVCSGGKVVGYYCSLVPGELFSAANIAPYRIRGGGSEDTSIADVYLSSHLCSFVRHTTNLALEGRFDFLNGIVATNGCDQARRAYDIWEKKIDLPFSRIFSVPRVQDQSNLGFYLEELQNLVGALEQEFAVTIGPEQLRDAIKLHNRIRFNLGRLHALRKETDPPLTGAQATAATIAAHVMPLETYNTLLESLIQIIDKDPGDNGTYRARLIISGGEMDEPEFITAIEKQGGLVVYEDTCFGARYFEEPVAENGDPLMCIAERYFFRLSCARMENSLNRRYDHLTKMGEDYHADGYVIQRLNHCILNSGHAFVFSRRAKADGTPTLIIDREYLSQGYGQINTRVQAFLESIEDRREK